jgi:hypothetical protein
MTILPPKKDINAVLMLYWGWADLLQHVGMVRYYKEQYKSVSLVCLPHQKIFLEALYPDFNLFFVSCPDGTSSKDIDKLSKKLFDEDYLFLNEGKSGEHGHQNCWNFERACLRMNIQNEIPKTSIQYKNCQILKKFSLQKKLEIKERDKTDPAFDERIAFYTLSGMDHSIAFDYFDIIRDRESEDAKYSELVDSEEYSVVHHTYGMDISKVKEPLVYLNDNSHKIVDMMKIIENANEVHLHDSLYGVLCYFAYFSGKLKGPKFYFHKYARIKIPKFFNYDWMEKSNDWVILE